LLRTLCVPPRAPPYGVPAKPGHRISLDEHGNISRELIYSRPVRYPAVGTRHATIKGVDPQTNMPFRAIGLDGDAFKALLSNPC